jgi:hypothetical protein
VATLRDIRPGDRPKARRWIAAEIADLDPTKPADADRIVLLSTTRLLPPLGGALIFNLLYCLGFIRISGQVEGARVVDGSGKIHRAPERRAEETIRHFVTWIGHGPGSDAGAASLASVRRIHDHYARRYPISNETHVHTIALFAVQFDHLLRLVGAPGYSEAERHAQVVHWRGIGERLGVREMPETWEGMERILEDHERDPRWYAPTPEGHRCAESLIAYFAARWLPPGLRWAARPLLLSLLPDHVLVAIDEPRPPRPVVWLVRYGIRLGLRLDETFLPDRREPVDLAAVLAA